MMYKEKLQDSQVRLEGRSIYKKIPFDVKPPTDDYIFSEIVSSTSGRAGQFYFILCDGLNIVDQTKCFKKPYLVGDKLCIYTEKGKVNFEVVDVRVEPWTWVVEFKMVQK